LRFFKYFGILGTIFESLCTILGLGGLSVFRMWSYRSSNEDFAGVEDSFNRAEFALARYEPMARLLSDEDLGFLKAQPGFSSELGRKFSRERRRIFRLYLQELAKDFHRLHRHARAVVASLPADHSPLVGLLMRHQVRFWYEMLAIEARLSLGMVGACSVQARQLVEAIAAMHAEIGRATVLSAA